MQGTNQMNMTKWFETMKTQKVKKALPILSFPSVQLLNVSVKELNEKFAVIYHNCGNGTLKMVDAISKIGAMAYHFGNAIDLSEMLKLFPSDCIVMGNIDPSSQFRNGSIDSIKQATQDLLAKCSRYTSFVPSSGCDIPPMAKWDNIDTFFAAVDEHYKN